MKLLFMGLVLLSGVQVAKAQQPVKANYQLAAKFSPKRLEKMVFSTTVTPHWLKKDNRFWYEYETTEGKHWYIVNADKAEKKWLFDNAKLATELSRIMKDAFDMQHLPIDSVEVSKDEKSIRFEVKSSQQDTSKKAKKVYYFRYSLDSNVLTLLTDYTKPKHKPEWASVSPDGKTIVFARDYNLYYMDRPNYEKALKKEEDSTIVEHALTSDGVEYFAYGGSRDNESDVDKEKNRHKRKRAFVCWSPDAAHFAMVRTDERKVKALWVINSIADPRPTLETYKYQMPGEKEAPQDVLYLFDMSNKTSKQVNVGLFKDQDISLWQAPVIKEEREEEERPTRWLGNNTRFYIARQSRDLKKEDVLEIQVAAAAVTTIIEERANASLDVQRIGLVNEGKELVQWSERDGWGHFYLYDEKGTLKNQITSGPFHCNEIMGIDEARRILYFTANGREQGEDPYYKHLYKINLDGSGLTLLNAGNFEHTSYLNDNNAFFVDNYSRVNTSPVSVLYSAAGKKVLDLETADLRSLMAAGYHFPEIFTVKADDGITDLYGVMYKPYDFDSTRKYPIVEYVYPGPQTEAVNKAFSRPADRIDRLAQIGVIVITVGNRGGNPDRSRWYHTYGYGNLRDYGLADKKAAAEQLANRYAYIDIARVGIHGHSGGGFMSTAAMLVYPDFFKVAVSSSGNHDNTVYNRWWSEKHHGVKEVISEKGDTSFVYSIDRNQDLVKQLKGHLLLTTGDIDNNVSPANTIRVINALIKANKRFDVALLPGQRHAYGNMQEWFFWTLADYYSKWLLGDFSQPVDMVEMNRDTPLTGK